MSDTSLPNANPDSVGAVSSPHDQYLQWRAGRGPSLQQMKELGDKLDPSEFVEVLMQDMKENWDRGQRRTTANYLTQYPRLCKSPDVIRDLVYSEQSLSDPSGERDELPSIHGFVIIEALQKGGMGVVYKAVQTSLGRLVALKMIRSESITRDRSLLDRFQREVEIVSKISHPGIIPIYDAGELSQDRLFYSMMLMEGGSLNDNLNEFYENPYRAAKLLEQVADAVNHAHENRIVHRDLKPGNILLDRDKRPFVADFGLALPIDEQYKLTEFGARLGTKGYMAPGGNRTEKDDIYCIGLILYELVTSKLPTSPDPLNSNIKIPASLLSICRKCLKSKPEDRYESAAEVAQELRSFVEGQSNAASSTSRKGLRWPWILGLLLFLAVLASSCLSYLQGVHLEKKLGTINELDKNLGTSSERHNELVSSLGQKIEAQSGALTEFGRKLGTSAELHMEVSEGTGEHYLKLIPYIKEASKEILIATYEPEPFPNAKGLKPKIKQPQDARTMFYSELKNKMMSSKDLKYKRIVCFPEGIDRGKITKDRLEESAFEHCEQLWTLRDKIRAENCELKKALAIFKSDILVIDEKVAAIHISARDNEKMQRLRTGVLIFHNPPDDKIITELLTIFRIVDESGKKVEKVPEE
jgi:serine/threonine-protein kinase